MIRYATIAVVACLLAAAGIALQLGKQNAHDPTNVAKVVDGDTFEMTDGKTIRLIGIDTPESVDPDQPVQCGALDAHDELSSLIEGKQVKLVLDKETTDDYGRTLAYVYADGEFINAKLAEEGFARYYDFPPNTKFSSTFHDLVYQAIDAKRGIWGDCPDAMTWASS